MIGKIESSTDNISYLTQEYVTRACLEDVIKSVTEGIEDMSKICMDHSNAVAKELQHLINLQECNITKLNYKVIQLYDKVEELESKNKILSKIIAGCIGAIVGTIIGLVI